MAAINPIKEVRNIPKKIDPKDIKRLSLCTAVDIISPNTGYWDVSDIWLYNLNAAHALLIVRDPLWLDNLNVTRRAYVVDKSTGKVDDKHLLLIEHAARKTKNDYDIKEDEIVKKDPSRHIIKVIGMTPVDFPNSFILMPDFNVTEVHKWITRFHAHMLHNERHFCELLTSGKFTARISNLLNITFKQSAIKSKQHTLEAAYRDLSEMLHLVYLINAHRENKLLLPGYRKLLKLIERINYTPVPVSTDEEVRHAFFGAPGLKKEYSMIEPPIKDLSKYWLRIDKILLSQLSTKDVLKAQLTSIALSNEYTTYFKMCSFDKTAVADMSNFLNSILKPNLAPQLNSPGCKEAARR